MKFEFPLLLSIFRKKSRNGYANNKLFLFAFLFLSPFLSLAQHVLTVEIMDLRNSKGKVHISLVDENQNQVAGLSQLIKDEKCVIVFKDLKPGKYAFSFFHDENEDEVMNVNWMGMPKEGIGFSNNPSSKFGPPPFDKTVFEINESIILKPKTKYL